MEDRKEYYEINKEQISNTQKEYQKVYRYVNKDEIIKKRKEFYENNKEEIKERIKNYYEENKEKMTEYHRNWYDKNKEKYNENRKCKECKLFYVTCKFIRYNPDNKNFKKREKQEKLIEILNENVYKEMLDDIEVEYLFY